MNDSMQNMVAEMRNYADIAAADSVTVTNAPTVIRSWADRLAALQGSDHGSGRQGGEPCG